MKEVDIDELTDIYEDEISKPSHLLKSTEEVYEYLEGATLRELKYFERACVKEENFLYAGIARDIIILKKQICPQQK